MTKKYKVLFLGSDNSARSIMAEALLRELGGHRFEAFSAGAKPASRVHSLAMAQLRPGISDLDRLNPKSWLEFTGEWAPRMDVVIAMGEQVAEYHAPAFPGRPECCQWNIPDPLAVMVTDAERARLFKSVFWQILRRVNLFISLPRPSTSAPKSMGGTEPSFSELHCRLSADRSRQVRLIH
ncbi:arsenate reductase ArsC [Trinickia violacea]|uniref:Arsenate reductase ArsC n=1 Tax=Trinickia violacea TaxID=2571746 RepID=A0A4P8IHY6_9BURK|nr:arsenate reductase ArsC [Trinickia violacea]QCP48278.1 arsenate reductase ArsC [Trinickia violacea]